MLATDAMLTPYRVIDRCDERGAFAGALLAMLGAEVVLAEPPEGLPLRHRPPFVDDIADPERSLLHLGYSQGKRSVTVAGADELHALLADADVLLETGLPTPGIAERHPHLVHVTISGFGATGPKAGWAESDLVCAAAGGQLAITGQADRAPLRCAVPQVYLHASADAAIGALVALAERAISGLGQHVDIAAQHSWLLAAFHYPLYPAWGQADVARNGSHVRIGAVASRFDFDAADGNVTYLLLFGAAVGPFTNRFVAWMLECGECDPSFAGVDWATFVPDAELERFERLQTDVERFLHRRTRADLLANARSRRLLIAPMLTLADVLASDHFVERATWAEVTVDDRVVRTPGPFVHASPTPLPVPTPAPALGEHTGHLAPRAPATVRPADYGSTRAAAPLAGVKVLDLTISFAGPTIGRILADFGATVVKVESVRRPDLARTAGPFLGGDTVDSSACFAHFNAGKQSIALDLSKPEARPVLADLAACADVLVQSYAPGALARMGLDADTLRRLNPRLVVLSSSMLGQTGPFSTLAGYGNMASALTGFNVTTAWPDRRPAGPMGAYTDIISPRIAVTAVLAALDRQRRTGEGVHFDLGQGESCLHLLTLGLLDTQLNGRSWEGLGNRDHFAAPHGVYPAQGEDRWVAIACTTDTHWHDMAQLMGRTDLAALCLADRLARVDELDALVASWTAERAERDTEAELQALGVPCHAVQNGSECVVDPQLAHRRWVTRARHELIGELPIGRFPVLLSATPAEPTVAGPLLGQHTEAVLSGLLGYDGDRIAALAIAEALE